MVAARTGTAKILVVSDDPYFYGRVTSATAALPLECGVVYVRDAQHALATTEFDGLILDARDQLSFILEVAERIAIQSVGDSSVSTRTPILVHLRPQDLAKVRFPEKLNCDRRGDRRPAAVLALASRDPQPRRAGTRRPARD